MKFTQHTPETAPDESKPLLETARRHYGTIPNLFGYLAEAPAALAAYQDLFHLFSTTSFSPAQQQLILLTVSVANECEYCVAAHSRAGKAAKLAEQTLIAVRNSEVVEDAHDAALVTFTQTVVDKRGRLTETDLTNFDEAGFTQQQVLEVLVGVSLKTLANYTNHLTHTELNPFLEPFVWTAPASQS